MAQELSDDGSASSGGVIDSYITAAGTAVDGSSSYFAEYTQAAYELAAVGDYTQEPVLSSAGYHIIKIDDIRSGFDASKEDIKTSLTTVAGEEVQALLEEKITALRETSEIVENVTYKYYDPATAEATGEEAAPADGEEEPAPAEGE